MNEQLADATRIVTFRLGPDLFAADIAAVERVLKYETPRGIPNVPAWIEGVIEYQGRVVPVIDLRRRFELAHDGAGTHTRMIVFSTETELVAVVVDAVLDVRALPESELAEPPAFFRGLAGAYLRGLARRDGELVVVLDANRLLSSRDRLALEPALRAGSDA
ncbi:MAG TPA: chemotaxis protein CheW [Gemmatimonadaceae bacterium]|nr:chemotaxis protein CheW [Gemmatimonadaceae bacterium]